MRDNLPMPMRPPIHRPAGRAAAVTEENRKLYDRNRTDQVHRKLLNRKAWLDFREYILRKTPLCQDCRETAPNEVHHIRGLADHPEDWLDEEQVLALCKPCHSRRTARGE